jgi:hypothetical protein
VSRETLATVHTRETIAAAGDSTRLAVSLRIFSGRECVLLTSNNRQHPATIARQGVLVTIYAGSSEVL